MNSKNVICDLLKCPIDDILKISKSRFLSAVIAFPDHIESEGQIKVRQWCITP